MQIYRRDVNIVVLGGVCVVALRLSFVCFPS